jgi:hypothetical protein
MTLMVNEEEQKWIPDLVDDILPFTERSIVDRARRESNPKIVKVEKIEEAGC